MKPPRNGPRCYVRDLQVVLQRNNISKEQLISAASVHHSSVRRALRGIHVLSTTADEIDRALLSLGVQQTPPPPTRVLF